MLVKRNFSQLVTFLNGVVLRISFKNYNSGKTRYF